MDLVLWLLCMHSFIYVFEYIVALRLFIHRDFYEDAIGSINSIKFIVTDFVS
jgi:hypothetical protein